MATTPANGAANVPTYAKVRYESVYPGVDLVYYGTQGGELEYDFVVAPGADPKAIALGIDDAGTCPAPDQLGGRPCRPRFRAAMCNCTNRLFTKLTPAERPPTASSSPRRPITHRRWRVITPWTRKTTFASSLAPMTTTGRWSLTRFSFTPPTWAAVEATSVTPSRLTPISTLTSRASRTLPTSPPPGHRISPPTKEMATAS